MSHKVAVLISGTQQAGTNSFETRNKPALESVHVVMELPL